MASCPKCGKAKIRRNKQGQRKCGRCGFLPSNRFMDRGGNAPQQAHVSDWRHYLSINAAVSNHERPN